MQTRCRRNKTKHLVITVDFAYKILSRSGLLMAELSQVYS